MQNMHVCCKCLLTDGLYNISSPILPEIKKEEATNPLYSDILRDYHLHPSQHSNSGPPEQRTAGGPLFYGGGYLSGSPSDVICGNLGALHICAVSGPMSSFWFLCKPIRISSILIVFFFFKGLALRAKRWHGTLAHLRGVIRKFAENSCQSYIVCICGDTNSIRWYNKMGIIMILLDIIFKKWRFSVTN